MAKGDGLLSFPTDVRVMLRGGLENPDIAAKDMNLWEELLMARGLAIQAYASVEQNLAVKHGQRFVRSTLLEALYFVLSSLKSQGLSTTRDELVAYLSFLRVKRLNLSLREKLRSSINSA